MTGTCYDVNGNLITVAERLTRIQQVWIGQMQRKAQMPITPTKVLTDLRTFAPGTPLLIIRQYGLGDVLLLTPLLRKLSREHHLVIDFQTLAAYQCFFQGNPYIRQTFSMEDSPSKWDYAASVNLDESDEPARAELPNRILHYAASVGISLKDDEMDLDYFVKEEEIENMRGEIAHLPRPRIAVSTHANVANRSWSEPVAEGVYQHIVARGGSCVFLAARMQNVPQGMGFLDKTGYLPNLRDVAALMAACDGVIAPDTGLFHLAAAMNLPLLTYFGAFAITDRASRTQKNLTLVNNPETCVHFPCREYSCPFMGYDKQSPCLLPDYARLSSWIDSLPVDK